MRLDEVANRAADSHAGVPNFVSAVLDESDLAIYDGRVNDGADAAWETAARANTFA